MGIRERGGSWQARLMIGGRTFSGSFPTREAAEQWETITRAQAIQGALPTSVTVAQYAERWMTTYDHAPANTRRFHRAHLDRWILPHIGRSIASSVTPSDITRLMNLILRDGTPATADRVYRTLSALFHAAQQDDVIARVPTRSKRHRPRRQTAPHEVLERAQARRMLLQLGGWQRDAALLQLSFGARVSEIAGLTAHDVDLAASKLRIVRRVSVDTVRATKNHRARILAIPSATRATLERLVVEHGAAEPLPNLADREHDAKQFARRWLIQTSTGRHVSLTAYNRALSAACEAAEVPTLSSHGLRHTYVSWMIDAGHSADKIAFWVGDTPETVRRVYAHMLEASSEPAAAEIDAALGELG